MKRLSNSLVFILFAFVGNAQLTVENVTFGQVSPRRKTVYNDKLYFYGMGSGGLEVWNYDGSNLRMPFDVPGESMGTSSQTSELVVAGSKLYFAGNCNTGAGCEPAMWDGVNTPVVVSDISSGIGNSNPTNFVALKGRVYFGAAGSIWEHAPLTTTTRRLTNAISFGYMVSFKDKLFFAKLGTPAGLYQYDPVTDKIEVAGGVTDIYLAVGNLSVCYDKLYFTAFTDTYGYELYVYDGSNSPVRLTDINPGKGSSMQVGTWHEAPPYIIGYRGAIYFSAGIIQAVAAPASPHHLYRYDPALPVSMANPLKVFDVETYNTEFCEFDGKLYFMGYDNTHGLEPWVYDGINKPEMVADINPIVPAKPSGNFLVIKGNSSPQAYAIYKNDLYFSAYNGSTYDMYRLTKNPSRIENVNHATTINVYPNPTTNQLYFAIDMKSASTFAITLVNITGREVYNTGMQQHSAGKASMQVNISQLVPGTYTYRITTQDGIMLGSGKVLKQ